LIKAVILGFTQGLTEFLPVSSSGHLFFIQRILLRIGMVLEGDALSFFVFLHLATLGAVCVFFAKSLHLLFNRKLLPHILMMSVITGGVALAIRFSVSNYFSNKYFLAGCFFINALILFSIRRYPGSRNWQNLNLRDSFTIGLLQGAAFLPGISRSGITIAGFIRRGFKKEEAFMLSFIIVIPVIIGAFLMEYHELLRGSFSILTLGLGFLCALGGGLLALVILRKAIIMEKFRKFSFYSLFIAVLTLFT